MTWKWMGASAVGTSHVQAGMPCQDRHLITSTIGGHLIMLVADGAGSVAHSHHGAELTCNILARLIQDHLELHDGMGSIGREAVMAWIATARRGVLDLAAGCGLAAGDYASTCLGVILGDGLAHCFQIGDGGIVIDGAGGLRSVFSPHTGEYAGETVFITCDKAADLLMYEAIAGVDLAAVFTDGVQDCVVDRQTNAPHGPFFQQMGDYLRSQPVIWHRTINEQLERSLSGERFNELSHDDKTLAFALRV